MSDAPPVLVIGNKNYSSWSFRPWLLLRHFAIDFDELRLPLDSPQFSAEIGALSPTRRVPVLRHDGQVIWDSLAICEYANETWLDGAGWPSDRRLRALARCAAAEMHSGFADLRSQLPMNCSREPDGYRWDAAAQRDIDRVQGLWCELLAASGGPFLGGGFGIVDAMFAPVAIRVRGYGVALGPIAQGWVEQVLDLPASRRWIEDGQAEPERLAKYESLRG